MSVSVLEKIEQYQKSIEKYHGNEEKLLYYIKKLSGLPVTVAHLQATGVGRTINSLRKSNGEVRSAAKDLVAKWKDMVSAEEAEGEEETEKKPEQVVPVNKYASPDGNAHKRRCADNHTEQSDKKRRKDKSPDAYDSAQSRYSHHHREQGNDRKKPFSPYAAEESPQSPDTEYVNGHYSESDNEELRIEDEAQEDEEEERQSASDVEPPELTPRSLSQDSNHTPQKSSDGESTKKASSSKSHSHKDSKHKESSKHHHDSKERSSRKDHSSSSHKSKDEKKDKSEKSHRKHEKHKSKSSSRDEEAKKSPKKSHHSSSSKTKDKDSRSKENSEKQSPVKFKSDVKIKQEPVDESSPEKTDKSETKKSSSSSSRSKSDKHKDKRKSSDKEKKEERKSSQKEKMKDLEDNGVDSYSGASFGDVLGMIGPTKSSKKRSLSSPSTSKGVTGYDPLRPDYCGRSKSDKDSLDSPSEEDDYAYNSLRPSVIEEDLLLPEISPNYRPLPTPNYSYSPAKRMVSDDEALSHIISSKQMRTKVYSGNKSGYTHVPSLFEICTRVLQDNIEALGYTGGVPFHLLKPVLEHATAEQLHLLEHYNPYLIEDTDAIWQFHCQKDFRNKKREEMETWRDMYLRCVDEREEKLKSLTSSIQNSMSKWTPVRKTKLAYVEGTVKPPRGVARKQAKFGSALPQPKTAAAAASKSSSFSAQPSNSSTGSSTGSSTTTSSFGGRQHVMAAPTTSVPNPRAGPSHSSSGSLKPKPKAPLMQKALQAVRNRFKR